MVRCGDTDSLKKSSSSRFLATSVGNVGPIGFFFGFFASLGGG